MAFRANKDEQERWDSLERMGVSVSLVIEGQMVWMDLRASKEISVYLPSFPFDIFIYISGSLIFMDFLGQ